MIQLPKWEILIIFFHILLVLASSETIKVRQALVEFMNIISQGNIPKDVNFGWNLTSDPCINKWEGVACDSRDQHVRRIVLDQHNLTGILDAASLCAASSLAVLSLIENEIRGTLPQEISDCRSLTHLYLHKNNMFGNMPSSISRLNNLKRLVISDNAFSGSLPDVSRISGLLTFLVENNQFSGQIPEFDFSNLAEFNVSNNNFSGQIPNVDGHFDSRSFIGNPRLCGELVSNTCLPPPPRSPGAKQKRTSLVIYLGYAILGLIIIILLSLALIKRSRNKKNKVALKKGVSGDNVHDKTIGSSSSGSVTSASDFKNVLNRSEYSITSDESGELSSSFEILSSHLVNNGIIRFDDLLRAPAELAGKGRHGSVYKVKVNEGVTLIVKRIRGWGILKEDFKQKMQRIHQVKHPHVLPLVAFYSSKQEKLIVYEYQQNGSLYKHLHESQAGQNFDFGSRLGVAANVGEALAFMHEGLKNDGIPHGNLKSTNILLNKDMEACVSKYGLMTNIENNQDKSFVAQTDSIREDDDAAKISAGSAFKMDVYNFGVMILELLTGKTVQASGYDLARWVNSVVREEWTGEVFDKVLVTEGASEERMVKLLQVALKCINSSPNQRPNMREVAVAIHSIKEDDEKSMYMTSIEV